MAYRGLETATSFTLLGEVDEAVALAQVGVRTLDGLRYVVEEHAAVLTLLSIASEKLLKVSVGLAALDDGNGWPSKTQMRAWGHEVARLDHDVRNVYRTRLARSTAAGYITQLLAACESDALLGPFLALLSRWGERARFHRLDELSGSPQSEPSGQAMWEELESTILEEDADLLVLLADPEGYDTARSNVNRLLSKSYRRWWELHTRAWMTGVLGRDARALSVALSRVDTAPPSD